MTDNWVVLVEVAGMPQAEILRGLLEAQEIPTVLSHEGAGQAIGLTIGALGAVQILIPSAELERAQALLDVFYTGEDPDDNL